MDIPLLVRTCVTSVMVNSRFSLSLPCEVKLAFCFDWCTGWGHSKDRQQYLKQMHSAYPNFLEVQSKEMQPVMEKMTQKAGALPQKSAAPQIQTSCSVYFPNTHFASPGSFSRMKIALQNLDGFDDLTCSECGQTFKSTDACKRHKMKHQESMFKHECTVCFKRFYRRDALKSHQRNRHKVGE